MYAACQLFLRIVEASSRAAHAQFTVRLSQMIEAFSCSQELYTRGTQNVSQIVETPSCSRKNNLNTH